MMHRCLLLSHQAGQLSFLSLPKTSNADVRNQGGGTISDVSLLHVSHGSFITFLNAIEIINNNHHLANRM